MASLQHILDPNIYHVLAYPYKLFGLLVMVGLIIKPSNQTHRKKRPMEMENKRLKGKIQFLQNQLDVSEGANERMQRDRLYWRSVAEERERKLSSLKKKLKSSSFYQHQIERKLLNQSRHRL